MTSDQSSTAPTKAEYIEAYLKFNQALINGLSELLAELPAVKSAPIAKPTTSNELQPIGATKLLAMRIAIELADHNLLDPLTVGGWSEVFTTTVNTIDRTLSDNDWMFDQEVIKI